MAILLINLAKALVARWINKCPPETQCMSTISIAHVDQLPLKAANAEITAENIKCLSLYLKSESLTIDETNESEEVIDYDPNEATEEMPPVIDQQQPPPFINR
ncbi:hypothetical protein AVEN_119536-1 [Araneus ventricosus]|uniref:DDE-1 domain-containing protein n=1 Tax=Araneus ventricosus TaxID=182803 RepID=A0A4Y2JDV7_ARAVE|nr:hypothetical protein AVEN_119536-1 [Araneus ventricosus]